MPTESLSAAQKEQFMIQFGLSDEDLVCLPKLLAYLLEFRKQFANGEPIDLPLFADRLTAQLRALHYPGSFDLELRYKDITFRPRTLTVYTSSTVPQILRYRDGNLLALMMNRPEELVTRAEIVQGVGYRGRKATSLISRSVNRIRQAIGDHRLPSSNSSRYIQTIYATKKSAAGYVLESRG